jgi:hypothetical protein
MKKKMIVVLFLFLIMPLVPAVEFDMKTNFSQGETLIAKLSGNFLEQPSKDSINFYRGHVKVPIEYDLAKINDEFYIYAMLPENEANYSIVIKNVKYYQGSQISEKDIAKNFSTTKNLADFSINPGFIITNDDFYIEVQNLQDYKINIQIKTETISPSNESSGGFFASLFGEDSSSDEEEYSITLKSGEIKKINFKLEDIEQAVTKTIELSTDKLKYEIPVYIFLNYSSQKKKKRDFEFEPSILNFSISTNSNITKIIYLSNIGENDLENISFIISESLEPYLIPIENIEELKENKTVKIELHFASNEEEKIIEGQIKAKESSEYGDIYAYTAVFLNIVKDYIPLDEEDEIIITKTCSEMGGEICSKNQECEGKIENAKDDKCCIGTCKDIEKSSTGKIIGWLIIIFIIVFLIWFFKFKYKKVK